MPDITTLRTRLSKAEKALHRLITGELEVTVSVGGYGATTYVQTDINKLNAYITKLKSEIASREGRRTRGPLFMKF